MSDGRSYQAVPITGEGDPAQHPLAQLVLALFSVGIRPLERDGFMETIEVVGEGEEEKQLHRFSFLLQPKSHDGKHETAKLVEAWLDPERKWFKANPEHLFSYMEGRTRQEINFRSELAKSVPLLVVRKGDRTVLIPADASPEEEAALLANLDHP